MYSTEFIVGANFGAFIMGELALLIIVVSVAIHDDFRKHENVMFFCACVSLMMLLAVDYSVETYPVGGLYFTYSLLFMLSYILVNVYLVFFTHYMVLVLAEHGFINKSTAYYIGFFPAVMSILWIFDVHGVTDMFIIVNRDCTYEITEYYSIIMAVPLLVLIFDLFLAWSFVTRDNYRDYLPWIFYGVFPLVALGFVDYFGVAIIYDAEVIGLLLVYSLEHNVRVKKMAETERLLTNAKMKLMISQIQPHFMYNSLNSIYYLIEQDPETAQEAVSDFSDYLRQNINALKCETTVSFTEELAHTETYLSLEKMRFGKKLNIETDIKTEDFLVPPLSLQPIVENAVKHGVTKRPEGGTVKISTFEDGAGYYIIVDDNGVGFNPADGPDGNGTHIGMDSVKGRLKAMCGGDILVSSQVGIGTRVIISIPKENTNEKNTRS